MGDAVFITCTLQLSEELQATEARCEDPKKVRAWDFTGVHFSAVCFRPRARNFEVGYRFPSLLMVYSYL